MLDTHERRMVTPHRLYIRLCPSDYRKQRRVETYLHINSFALTVLADGCLDGYFSVGKLLHGCLNQESG